MLVSHVRTTPAVSSIIDLDQHVCSRPGGVPQENERLGREKILGEKTGGLRVEWRLERRRRDVNVTC
jgi:hypothetical protein